MPHSPPTGRSSGSATPHPPTVGGKVAARTAWALATMVAATEPLSGGGGTALIQGAGLLGLFGCALLRDLGWKRVLVVDPHPDRLALVANFGGEPLSSEDGQRRGLSSVDAVLEVAGTAAVVPEGLRLLRPGGHYAFVGMVHPDTRLDVTGDQVIRKCLTLRGTHNYAPRHLETAVGFLAAETARRPWQTLVSDPLPLGQLDQAFALARSGRWARVSVAP